MGSPSIASPLIPLAAGGFVGGLAPVVVPAAGAAAGGVAAAPVLPLVAAGALGFGLGAALGYLWDLWNHQQPGTGGAPPGGIPIGVPTDPGNLSTWPVNTAGTGTLSYNYTLLSNGNFVQAFVTPGMPTVTQAPAGSWHAMGDGTYEPTHYVSYPGYFNIGPLWRLQLKLNAVTASGGAVAGYYPNLGIPDIPLPDIASALTGLAAGGIGTLPPGPQPPVNFVGPQPPTEQPGKGKETPKAPPLWDPYRPLTPSTNPPPPQPVPPWQSGPSGVPSLPQPYQGGVPIRGLQPVTPQPFSGPAQQPAQQILGQTVPGYLPSINPQVPTLQPAPAPVVSQQVGAVNYPQGTVTGTGTAPKPDLQGLAEEMGRQEKKLAMVLDLLQPSSGTPAPGSTANLLGDLINDLIQFLLSADPGTTYRIHQPCGRKADGSPLDPVEVVVPPSVGLKAALDNRLDALAELIDVHKGIRQPICKGKPAGEPVTVYFREML